MRALLVDAYDSFVHIIDHYLRALDVTVRVLRRDDPAVSAALGDTDRPPDFVVLGPGPGHPADSGYVPLLHGLDPALPVLGICLGHQAIGLAHGGRVERARPRHGKASPVGHDGAGCFTGLPSPLRVTRYHSLVVDALGLPDELTVTARAHDDGHVMGLRHRARPVESLQFHPESIGTEHGLALFRNFIDVQVRPTRHG